MDDDVFVSDEHLDGGPASEIVFFEVAIETGADLVLLDGVGLVDYSGGFREEGVDFKIKN